MSCWGASFHGNTESVFFYHVGFWGVAVFTYTSTCVGDCADTVGGANTSAGAVTGMSGALTGVMVQTVVRVQGNKFGWA